MRFFSCTLCALAVACSSDPGGVKNGFIPDVICPGPGCRDSGDTQLQVGYARTSINPTADNMTADPFAAFANWVDTNCNDQWDPGETGNDTMPAGAWMAGYGSGRPALGVHADDGLDARVIVLRTHGLTIALAELDLVGYFYDEIQKIRDLVKQNGDPVDLVLVGSTHVHEGPDSVGIWGRDDGHSGVDLKYHDFLNHAVAQTIHAALGKLEPAVVTIGSAKTEDAGDMSPYVADTRDPVIIDNTLTAMLFKRPDGTPITALINWSSHPEIEGGRNHLISADYVNYLRQGLERGFTRMGRTYPSLAPDVLFINGEVGGLLTGLHTHPIGDDGQPVALCGQPQHPPAAGCPDGQGGMRQVTPDDCFAAAVAQGHGVAAFAHKALANGATTVSDLPPVWRTKKFVIYVDNVRFQIAFLAGLFMDTRSFVAGSWDRSQPIDRNNTPQIESESTYLRLGPASLVSIPGELFPELFIGGYQGEFHGSYPLVHSDNPNPPDLTKAPPPPYVCDLMEGEYRMAFGLTGDFVGYIIPDYDFELGTTPYVSEAMGDHYEETNSLGDRGEPSIIGTIKQLITYGRSGTPEMLASPCPGR
jgi:hypothetical protein